MKIKMKKIGKFLSLFVSTAILAGAFSAPNIYAAESGGAVFQSKMPTAYQEKLENGINAALAGIKPTMSSLEKVKAVNEYLAKNVKYDMDGYKTRKITAQTASVYGALVNKKTTCSGYSCAFHLLMNRLGIPDALVASITMNHSWNMVWINGNWYHVDTTWDRKDLYGCFMKSDTAIAKAGHGLGMKRAGHYGWESEHKATSTKYDNFDWAHATAETINRGLQITTARIQLDTSAYKGKAGSAYIFLAKSNIGEYISATSTNDSVAKVTLVSDNKNFLYKIQLLKAGTAEIRIRSASNATQSIPVTIIR